MAIVNVPSGGDAFYINEQKDAIQTRIADGITPNGGAITLVDSPTAAQIASSAIIILNPSKAGIFSLPNLKGVVLSGDSTVVYLRNISAYTLTINGAANVNVNASQYANTLNNTTNIVRTYVAVQDGDITDYYAVA